VQLQEAIQGTQTTHATENKRVSYPAMDWWAACFFLLRQEAKTPCGQQTHTSGAKRASNFEFARGTQQIEDALSRYQTAFYRKACQHLRNEYDAEDAVQDALLAAYKNLDQFRGQAQMSTWLTAIVINCARMHLRRRSRQTLLSLDDHFGEDEQCCLSDVLADATPSPEAKCRESELHRHLMQFVAQLSPSLRTAFELRDLEELTTSEAAHILGVPEGTVKARVSRARAKLRRLMRQALGKQIGLRSIRSSVTASGKQQQQSRASNQCPALLT
jgi:RNA polymerase sigma-70 factor, ECF subfamily